MSLDFFKLVEAHHESWVGLGSDCVGIGHGLGSPRFSLRWFDLISTLRGPVWGVSTVSSEPLGTSSALNCDDVKLAWFMIMSLSPSRPGCITALHRLCVLPSRTLLSDCFFFRLFAGPQVVKVRKRDETLLIWRATSIEWFTVNWECCLQWISSIPLCQLFSFLSDLCLYLFTVRFAWTRVSFPSFHRTHTLCAESY